MSINNSILKLLNMEDKNINFTEKFVEEREINNRPVRQAFSFKINKNMVLLY